MLVIEFFACYFPSQYVDMIAQAGANCILAEGENAHIIQRILDRLAVFVNEYGAVGIAVIGHAGCAGNPSDKKG